MFGLGPTEGVMLFVLLALVPLYFLPWIVGAARRHHNSGAILALNLLLGWTGLGWIGAFVWACTSAQPRQVAVVAPVAPAVSGSPRYCTHCGAATTGDAQFCPRCGVATVFDRKAV